MVLFKKEEDCCGCSACASICPVYAITMAEDAKGFLYPEINKKKCIECRKCVQVCPLKKGKESNEPAFKIAYAIKNKDEYIRMNSSSGGFFYTLANYILENDGVVYGAVFDNDFRVMHMRSIDNVTLQKMQGSKYLQSNMGRIFKSVKQDLVDGKTVLFTGCPCQIDGLKHYLNDIKQDKLLTCDLICHGVNSPKFWKNYLDYIRKGKEVTSISFRDKSSGWRNPALKIQMQKSIYMEIDTYDCFFQAFYSGNILRPSCFSCKYSNLYRKADITMGDFWGIESVFPEIDDNKGISLVIVNTLKGKEAFSMISEKFLSKNTEIENCLQHCLVAPVIKPRQYEKFWEDYINEGFLFVYKKYLSGGIKGTVKRKIRIMLEKAGIWKCIKLIYYR